MRRTGFCSLLVLAALPARVSLATVASDLCPAVSADAFTTEGLRDRDSLKLTCMPAAP